MKTRRSFVPWIGGGLILACILSGCWDHHQPEAQAARAGSISVYPFTSGPDTLMQFISGPDTLGIAAETLWVMKRDCTLTIRYTSLPPAGPDTLLVDGTLRVIAKRLPKPEQVKR